MTQQDLARAWLYKQFLAQPYSKRVQAPSYQKIRVLWAVRFVNANGRGAVNCEVREELGVVPQAGD